MTAKHSVLTNIQNGTFALNTDEEIARKLRLGKRESAALRDILHALVREGELLMDSRFRFGTAEQFGAMRGVLSCNERGFGFFVPENGAPDLFIPHRSMKNALHGDTVLAFCVGGRNGDEGEVLAVLERGYGELVGTYHHDRRAGRLCPDDRRFDADVVIPAGKHKRCPTGAKAVARITSYDGRIPVGEIVEVLGTSGDFFTEELALIRAHGLREEFPAEAVREAEKQALRDPAADLKGRKDLRGALLITVDGEDTRDIDDAISVRKKGSCFELGVHIADVSHYVARNRACDQEAFRRGTSVYFPDRVLPMLPPALSNGICSLNEGADRLTLSCFMTVDLSGKVVKKRVAPSIIRSRHRMTYTEMTKLIERDAALEAKYPDLIGFVADAAELTEILKRARERRGGVELDVKETAIRYENGEISIPEYERTVSHEMIEEFMILANESVASLMAEKEMPFVYRVHERPSEEKASGFLTFLKEIGIPAKFDARKVSPKDYRDLLFSLQSSPLSSLVSRVMLRSMQKARYSHENCGHFGLASDCYCHFTSPIRRYPDLCVHRIIKDALSAGADSLGRVRETYENFVEEASLRSSACEKNAADAEREVDALYIAAYMQKKIGEEYDATVSGVTGFGLFAELANTVEGFIPLEMLPDDSYDFLDDRFLLRGTKNTFRLGQRVRVKVVGVDFGTRRVQFGLLSFGR